MINLFLCLKYTLIFIVVTLSATQAFSEIYSWTDSNGQVHIVDDLSKVPSNFRKGDNPPDTDIESRRDSKAEYERARAIQERVEKKVSIEIIEYGLFTAHDLGKVPERNTTTGMLTVSNQNTLRLQKKTDKIPAVLGTKFGIKYRLSGTTPGEQLMIETKVLTPGLKKIRDDGPESVHPIVSPPKFAPAGTTSKSNIPTPSQSHAESQMNRTQSKTLIRSGRHEASSTHEEKWSSPKTVGEVTYDGFIFEKDWELVPGTWTIQIFYNDKKLGEQPFEVYEDQKKLNINYSSAIRKEIEKLLSDDCSKRLSAIRQLETIGKGAAPAIPELIRTLRYYSLPNQIAFDCGSGKAAPGVLAKIGPRAIKPLSRALADSQWNIQAGAKDALIKMGKSAVPALINIFQHETDMYIRIGAAEVLGGIQDKRAVKPLIAVLQKEMLPPIRGKAAEVLGILNDKRAVKPLSAVILNKKENWHVRSDSLTALLKIAGKKTTQELLASLRDETDSTFKSVVAEIVGQVDDTSTIEQLALEINDKDASIRTSALQRLSRKKYSESMPVLINALQNPDWSIRVGAAGILGKSRDSHAVDPLILALKDKDWNVRITAASALGALKDIRSVEPLMEMYKTEHPEKGVDIRPSVIGALGQLGDRRATGLIITAVSDNNSYVRRAAVEALGELKDAQAIGLLINIMKGKISGSNNYEAKISLGKMGEPAIRPLLESFRGERNHGNRLHSMDALVAIGTPCVEPLIQVLKDRDTYVKESAAEVLGRLKDSRAVMPLMDTLRDYTVNHVSARSLGLIGEPSVKPLVDAMRDPDPQYRMFIVMALGEIRNKLAVTALVNALQDNDPRVRSYAAEGLGRTKDAQVATMLIRALKDKDPSVRKSTVVALGKVEDKRAVEPLLYLLKTDPTSRWYSIESLGQIRDKRATKHIIPFLKDKSQQVRLKAAGALNELKDKQATAALIEALNDNDREVKLTAVNALKTITKKNFGEDPDDWRTWLKRRQKMGSKE